MAEHKPYGQHSFQGGGYVEQWCRCGAMRIWTKSAWQPWSPRECKEVANAR